MKKTENLPNVSLKKMGSTGIILLAIGFAFAVIETVYFGSNFYPESKAEFVCDYIATIVCGGGGSLIIYAITLITKWQIKGLLAQLKELKEK